MKRKVILLCSLLSLFLVNAIPVLAEEIQINGISEEGKEYLESEEHKKRIEAKNNWLSKQPQKRRGTGHMNVTHRTQPFDKNWCGAASLQMVIEYITGDLIPQSQLAIEAETDVGDKIGAYVNDVADVLNNHTNLPYEVEIVSEDNFFSNIKMDFDADYPVIYDVDAYVLDKTYDKGTGHYIVGSGYESNHNLYYEDPGRSFGAALITTESTMIEAINGNGGYYIY